MGQKVIVLESEDPVIRALQIAHVLPFTVTLDTPTDTAGELDTPETGKAAKETGKKERARIKKGLNKEYEGKIKRVKAEVYVGEDAPSGEPVEAFSDEFAAPADEEAPKSKETTTVADPDAKLADKK